MSIVKKSTRQCHRLALFASGRDVGSDVNNCTWSLPISYTPAKGQHIIIRTESVVFPNRHDLINSTNDKIYVVEDPNGLAFSYTLELTHGDYTAYSLSSHIVNLLIEGSDISGNGWTTWTVSFDSTTQKYTISNTDGYFNLYFDTDGPYQILGFASELIYSADDNYEITGVKKVDMFGLKEVFLTSNKGGVNTYNSITGKRSSVVAQLMLDVPSGYLVQFRQSDSRFVLRMSPGEALSSISIRLTDRDGDLIDYTDDTWGITLLIEFENSKKLQDETKK